MDVRLGKHDHKFDARTVKLARFMAEAIERPHTFDFDKNRSPFPLAMWGNDEWGDCVLVAQGNQLVRLERSETRHTIPITESHVVCKYMEESGAKQAGDENDTGLNMLDANRVWRSDGWIVGRHTYTIAAFGEIEPLETDRIRDAIWLLHGVQFGFALPLACQAMTREGKWDYQGQTGPEWIPGSWGGHAVYSKAYTPTGFKVITWAREIEVTDSFVRRYGDEVWAVVDSLDTWRDRPEFDADELLAYLTEIGSHPAT